MALSAQQQDLVSRIGQLLDMFLDVGGEISRYDTLFNGTPNWKADMTQPEIDDVPMFLAHRITANDIDVGLFVLKTMRTTLLTTDLPVVAKLAALG